jgi:hypothetical protein
MPTPKLIGRLTREGLTGPRSGPGRAPPLPEDLLRQATRRVEIMALVAATLWTLAPALAHVALYFADPGDPRWSHFGGVDAIALGCVVVSLAV